MKIMGQEIYNLIYVHYDSDGGMIADRDDILYCEEHEIEQKRIEPLKQLLQPVSSAEEALIPLEAAQLLAAWGVEEAIDYFLYCIRQRIDRLGNLCPDRLHGYDVTYELITVSLLHYYARCSDRSMYEEKIALEKIKPLILGILSLSKELPYNMMALLEEVRDESWRFCEPLLKECFITFLEKGDQYRNDYWNIIDLKLLFQVWDPSFLAEIEKQYGIIDISEAAKDRP